MDKSVAELRRAEAMRSFRMTNEVGVIAIDPESEKWEIHCARYLAAEADAKAAAKLRDTTVFPNIEATDATGNADHSPAAPPLSKGQASNKTHADGLTRRESETQDSLGEHLEGGAS
jgi:hypothetical protein